MEKRRPSCQLGKEPDDDHNSRPTTAMSGPPVKLQQNTTQVSTAINGYSNCWFLQDNHRRQLPFHCYPTQTTSSVQENLRERPRLSRCFCDDITSKKPLDERGESESTLDLLNTINNVHRRGTTTTTTTNFSSKKHNVSTSLTLSSHESLSPFTSSAKKHKISTTAMEEGETRKEDFTTTCVARVDLSRFRKYSEEDINEEKRLGVTTKLSLWFEDPWKIKKKLTQSDVGEMSRLLLHADEVEEHILPHLVVDNIRDGNELSIRVWDSDTHSEHQLVFAQWTSSGAYVLKQNWTRDFVSRRNLKVDDLVGLLLDPFGQPNSLLIYFSVLKRAASSIKLSLV